MIDLSPAISAYVQESQDILDGLERSLLDLEHAPTSEMVDSVFRALHTLKGGGGMFGFHTMAGVIHHFEDAYDRVREGKLAVTGDLIDVSLRARDLIIAMLALGGDGPLADAMAQDASTKALLNDLNALLHAAPDAAPLIEVSQTFHITFRPAASSLGNGMRPDSLVKELVEMGRADVRIDASHVPDLAAINPSESYLGWSVDLTTSKTLSDIEAVFIFADDAELDIRTQTPAASTLPALQKGAKSKMETAGPETQANAPRSDAVGDTIRVSANKLDRILDQLGELVIAQSRLTQIAHQMGVPELENLVEDVERLISGLRDSTMSTRMLPIEMVFGKFRRVVRDLSSQLDKDVELETLGGDTEIDKNVLDRLSEPLVHMIRNSMDHGIETAQQRIDAGKPAQGRLRLSARQETGEICITIQDDGKGLDSAAIQRKAVERGILSADATPSEAELHQLIFAPGFSTAVEVTSVSGRGVGMDAVRSTVTDLRGSLDVRSITGVGTAITLRLPLTLAIIDGLLVKLGQSIFVIPLSAVEECVEFDATDSARESGRTMVQIREMLVPFIDLQRAFKTEVSTASHRRVVIVRSDIGRVGLVVDDILGQNQTVIKPLSLYHQGLPGLSGATILGNGGVALIVDVTSLAGLAPRFTPHTIDVAA